MHDFVWSGGSTATSQMPPSFLKSSRLGRQSGGVTGVSPRSTVGHAARPTSRNETEIRRMPRSFLPNSLGEGKPADHQSPTAVGEESAATDSDAPVSASADTPTSVSLPLPEPWQPAQTWSNIPSGTPMEMTSPGPN